MPQHSYLDSVIVFCLLRVLLKITSGTELDVINPETVKSCPSLRMMIPKTCKLLLGKSFQNQSAFNRQKPCPFLSQNNKSLRYNSSRYIVSFTNHSSQIDCKSFLMYKEIETRKLSYTSKCQLESRFL